MTKREQLIKKIKALPDDSLSEADKLIDKLMESKRVKALNYTQDESSSLMGVVGICSGPNDLAERDNQYIYGKKKVSKPED